MLTGDRYALRLWTPRQPAADASEPPASPNRDTSPVNLLALIQPQTYRIGDWQMPLGALISPVWSGARLQFPYAPPPEYRVDIEVERAGREATYGFGIGCVAGGRQVEISIDQVIDKIGKCTGLQGLDGAPFEYIPTFHRGQLLFPNQPARLSLTVRRNSIKLTCDGSDVLDWKGDPTRFVPYHRWRIPNRNTLFLTLGSVVKFHAITLTPLTAASP